MPRPPQAPEELPEIDEIEVEAGPEVEEPQEAEQIRTVYGVAASAGTEDQKIVRRIRNIINDAINRHERFDEEARLERRINEIERDPYASHYEGLDEVDRARRRRDGVILSDRSSLEAIRQELDTLQRTLSERGE